MSDYAAFLSYSHADEAAARRLHRALETYRIPRDLIGTESPFGPVERRLPPVFRDREELPASADLGGEIRAALASSRFLVVLCSPRAVHSKWVNEEILEFKRLHGEARVLALILDGEPNRGGENECFPPALQFRLAADGSLSDDRVEPIAADLRQGKDGHRLALLKLVAGITGLKLDALVRRDAARRHRRMVAITVAALVIATLTLGLAIYADHQRRVAERQRQLAERSLDFLSDTIAISNPATENPRTISALTILDRVSARARIELRNEPEVSARLLRSTGSIYRNLGLLEEARRDLQAAIALEPPKSEGRARDWLLLAALASAEGDLEASSRALKQARASYDREASYAPVLDALVAEEQGVIAYQDGRYAESARILNGAAARFEALGDSYRMELASVWSLEARSLATIHKYDEADVLYNKAAAIYLEAYGPNHLQSAKGLQNQAFSDLESGRYARADQRMARAMAIYEKVLEGDHPTIARGLILTGRIKTELGDTRGAVRALDRAGGIFTRIYGPGNATVGDTHFYAAEALGKAGQTDAALVRTEQTKVIYDAEYGPDDPDQVELLLLRSRIFAKGGRFAEARQECERGLALQARLDPTDPALPETRKACAAIGRRN